MSKDVRTSVYEWGTKIGMEKALQKLQAVGLSHSTAYKLLLGSYESEPGKLAKQAIMIAMRN